MPVAKNGQVSSPAIAIPGRSFYATSYDNSSSSDLLYFFDRQSSYKISSVSNVIGTPGALAVTSDGGTIFASSTGGMTKLSIESTAPGAPVGLPQSLNQYRDFAFDMQRHVVYGTDASNRIDVIDQATGIVVRRHCCSSRFAG